MAKSRAAVVAVFLSIALPFAFVNGGNSIGLEDVIRRVVETGKADTLDSSTADELGLAPQAPARLEKSPGAESDDGALRIFRVVFSSTPPSAPAHVLLMAQKKDKAKGKVEIKLFRLNLDGSMVTGTVATANLGEGGGVVDGSGETQKLDPRSRSAKKLVRRELDFWLKGAGRVSRGPKENKEVLK